MDVFILIVTTRRLLGCACHNTGSLPRHFSPFPVQLVPSPRISASTHTIVDHVPLSYPPPRLLSSTLSSLDLFPRSQDHTRSFDFRLDRPASHATPNHIISDLKIYPSQLWISPHISFPFLSRLTFTSTQLTLYSRPPCIGHYSTHTQKFPCTYHLTVAACPHALHLFRSTHLHPCLLQL